MKYENLDTTLKDKSAIQSYAEFMDRKPEKIQKEYTQYREGKGEIPLEDPSLSPSEWVRERAHIDNMEICDVCEQIKTETYGYDGEQVCERCEQDDLMEPEATIKTSIVERLLRIGSYRNETEYELGEDHFTTEWISTDAWRGYVKVHAKGGWTKVDSDQILSMKNEEDIKKLDDKLQRIADQLNVEWARAVARTSNVFSSSWDFYVKGEDKKQFLEEVNE